MTDSRPEASPSAPVVAHNLRKEYGSTIAVQDSSFTVDEGSVLGIIGPNGSGKTTTLKMVAGLIEPTSGSVSVAGFNSQNAEMANHLGFLPEESPLYEDMTGVSYLTFFADLYEVPREVALERIHHWLDRLDLDQRDIKIGNMSKGMKRKVAITRSLVNDPEVLVYDEPASGLDPLSTRYIIEFIDELRDEGKTIVFSAHNLYHVSDLCDDVLMMHEGEVVAHGSLAELQADHGTTEYHVISSTATARSQEQPDGTYLTVGVSMADVDDIEAEVETNGGEVLDIRTLESSLEDIFVDLHRNE